MTPTRPTHRPSTHRIVLAALLAAAPLLAQLPVEAPYANVSGTLTGDFDGDGRHDLLHVDNGLRVWPGLGDGGFGPFLFTQAPGSKLPAAVGDLDGDGRDDVACWRTLGGEPARVEVSLATGDGLFAPAIPLFLPGGNGSVRAVALPDADGDGDLDVLVGRESEVRLLVWLGDGAGGFVPGPDIQGVQSVQQIA